MDRESPRVTQVALAKKVTVPGDPTPVSQKTISNLLHAVHDPSVELLQAVAEVFSLDLWQIIREDLRKEITSGKRVAKLIDNFYEASEEGQDMIDRFAEHEARKKSGANGF